jgi:uncharacterized protein
MKSKDTKSLLWKFYTNDPDVCHYIFGTMHLATKEAYTYVELAKKYITCTSLYAGEMDLDEASMHNMAPYFTLPDDQLFSQLFKPRHYNRYKKIIRKTFNVDISQLDRQSPFYISNLLSELVLVKEHLQPLDHHLWNFAVSSGKTMKGVESFEDQVSILNQIPLDYQIKAFRDMVSNIPSFNNKIRSLNSMYQRGDLNQLYKSSKKSMGKLRGLMIYDRNLRMTEKILTLSTLQPSFFSIGAAHLPGGKGILALLQKQGYKVKQVSM